MTGEPSFIELGVPDADAARAFYGPLLGWDIAGASGNGSATTPGLGIGIHAGDPKAWFEVFFAVPDLDAAMAQVRELGGSIDGEVHDSPGFGRWCEATDNQGVHFGLRQAY